MAPCDASQSQTTSQGQTNCSTDLLEMRAAHDSVKVPSPRTPTPLVHRHTSAGCQCSCFELLSLISPHGVQPYMDLIDKIRELGIERDLQGGIPQIAVMGDQSSGKSSVHLFPSSQLSCPPRETPLPGHHPARARAPAFQAAGACL